MDINRLTEVAGPGATPDQVHVARRLGRVLEQAFEEARRLRDDYVSVEHLLMALIDKGVITAVPREKFAEAVSAARGNQRVASATPEAAYEALEVSAEARALIAGEGFDPVYGARPLRRFIAREVETPIGRALLAGDVHDGAVIRVDLENGRLAVHHENPAEAASMSP